MNFSAKRLSHPDLVGEVGRVLEETGLDLRRLAFEVTEGVLVENAERHAATLGG